MQMYLVYIKCISQSEVKSPKNVGSLAAKIDFKRTVDQSFWSVCFLVMFFLSVYPNEPKVLQNKF